MKHVIFLWLKRNWSGFVFEGRKTLKLSSFNLHDHEQPNFISDWYSKKPQQYFQCWVQTPPSRRIRWVEELVTQYKEISAFPRLPQALPEQSKRWHAFPQKLTQRSWALWVWLHTQRFVVQFFSGLFIRSAQILVISKFTGQKYARIHPKYSFPYFKFF